MILLHCMWNGSMVAIEALVTDDVTVYPEPGSATLIASGIVLMAMGTYGWGRGLAVQGGLPAPGTV